MRCFRSKLEGTEKEENAIVFEDFPFVHNSAVFLRKLFEKKKITTIFWKGRGK
jgi:hypothetical protein